MQTLRRRERERLDCLADNPFYTKRFAYSAGRRCRAATIKDIAEELKLDWILRERLDPRVPDLFWRRGPLGSEPRTVLAANKRLNTAYLLKEFFGQLWEYEREC